MSGTTDVGNMGDFQYAQQQMNELDAASRQMHSEIASGQFTIEPDAARKAAKACRDQIARIDELLGEVRPLGTRAKFGDCGVGGELADKFAKKATGSDTSLEGLLVKSKGVLENMAKNYDDAARGYEQTDADNAFSYRAE
ncbi:hypothetical protein [Labedaea rhizosphaerae]|uniref:Excreted virulence factor EspC (Type VII ESX diderm) n=1 Tax=Labedaea rhizosphaerae TaxID=598644 RepID=A0A4R6SLT2_LABRH|nr:hypothetical protein [Labedaea rhizosphaerae]TDQ04272.1 hypothetical protein EV186_101215 [Labedaea rhizosphaerae]